MHAICLAIYLPVNVSVSLVPSMTTPLLMAMATLHLPVKIFFSCSFRYLAPLLVFLSHVYSSSLSLHLPSFISRKHTNTYLQRNSPLSIPHPSHNITILSQCVPFHPFNCTIYNTCTVAHMTSHIVVIILTLILLFTCPSQITISTSCILDYCPVPHSGLLCIPPYWQVNTNPRPSLHPDTFH